MKFSGWVMEQPLHPPLKGSKRSGLAEGTTPNKGRARGTWGDHAPGSKVGSACQAKQGRELPLPPPNLESGSDPVSREPSGTRPLESQPVSDTVIPRSMCSFCSWFRCSWELTGL